MKITIEFIPHLKQRYNTCGDWQFDQDGNLTIKVSEMPKTGEEGSWCVAIHELIEALLCRCCGITTAAVDKFDLAFDPLSNEHEPGDDPKCPCVNQHCIATGVERILVREFGLRWFSYENELVELTEKYDKVHK